MDITDNTDTAQEDKYLKRFETEFQTIFNEISMFSNKVLREHLANIRGWAEAAENIRAMQDADVGAVLDNLIAQIKIETDKIGDARQVAAEKKDELTQLLSKARNVEITEAFEGFDFYDNNPLKRKAEKKIAKLERKRNR
jgi:hypothetical protein